MPTPRIRLFISAILALTLRSATGAGITTGTGPSAADSSAEIALQRALDQPLTLSLVSVELAEAFKNIAATAKISLEVDAGCYEALPYGATIKVSADFRQSKLREALEVMLLPLGLQMEVSGRTVIIRPSEPLLRIGRRAEWDELKLLEELRSNPEISPLPANSPLDLTAAVRGVMEARKDLTLTISGSPPAPAHEQALDAIRKQLPMSAFRAINMYCQLTRQIWFVEAGPQLGGDVGGSIQIMTPRQWIQRQMERPIQMKRENASLADVVADLSQQSRIRFVPEPGLYQAVPIVSLSSSNGTVQQTLEALAGATRIAFEVRDDSILLHLAPGPGNQPARSEAIVGRIAVPVGPDGATMDVFIHESDLPPELNDLRMKKVQEAVEGLRKSWTQTPASTSPLPSPPSPPSPPASQSAPATRP